MVAAPEAARRYGVRPSKSLGQNFLVDPNTVRRIVRLAEVGGEDRVLEVGAGLGVLTVALAEKATTVVAIEFDRALLPPLREATGGRDNVEIVSGDAMKLDYQKIVGEKRFRMISNLPYNIATPLIVRLLEEVPNIADFVVMIQREVGERLLAKPKAKQYGAVSVLVDYFCDRKMLGRVPPTVFWPRPRVESVLLHLVRRPPRVEAEFAHLKKVVKGSFGNRRKTIRNSLAHALDLEASRLDATLRDAGIDPATRAESLALEDFARIAEALRIEIAGE